MAISLPGFKKQTLNRAYIYSFLSKIFSQEIDKAALEDFKSKNRPVDFDDPEINSTYREVQDSLNTMRIRKKFLDDLAADFASLFLGIGKPPVHPYESVYRTKDGIIMQKPWEEVLKIYREEGVEKIPYFLEPEDHISLELEFMDYMCLKTIKAINKQDRTGILRSILAQNEFVNKHLQRWIPSFCDDILKSCSKYDFYKIIAKFTKQYIKLEGRLITQLVNEFNYFMPTNSNHY